MVGRVLRDKRQKDRREPHFLRYNHRQDARAVPRYDVTAAPRIVTAKMRAQFLAITTAAPRIVSKLKLIANVIMDKAEDGIKMSGMSSHMPAVHGPKKFKYSPAQTDCPEF